MEPNQQRILSLIAGAGYIAIFVTGIFANFFVIEALLGNPLLTVQQNPFQVRLGIVAFIVTAAFDVIVAWALYHLFSTHYLSLLSTLFRVMHATIMAVSVYALTAVLTSTTEQAILQQVDTFNTIWSIGLFFFGIHLILLGRIIIRPKLIAVLLVIAGLMYMTDTLARFLLENYAEYMSVFLAMVAVPAIAGELSFAIYLLVKGGKPRPEADLSQTITTLD